MTARNFYRKYTGLYLEDDCGVRKAIIEHTKYHVQKALEKAAENAQIKTGYYNEEDYGKSKIKDILDSFPLASARTDRDGDLYAVDTYEIDKESILNCYPIELIQ